MRRLSPSLRAFGPPYQFYAPSACGVLKTALIRLANHVTPRGFVEHGFVVFTLSRPGRNPGEKAAKNQITSGRRETRFSFFRK
jgi:hypothetical protein